MKGEGLGEEVGLKKGLRRGQKVGVGARRDDMIRGGVGVACISISPRPSLPTAGPGRLLARAHHPREHGEGVDVGRGGDDAGKAKSSGACLRARTVRRFDQAWCDEQA